MAGKNEDVIFEDVGEEAGKSEELQQDPNEHNDGLSGQMLVSSGDSGREKSEEELLGELEQIENLAKVDPSIRDMDEYKNLKSVIDKNRTVEGEAAPVVAPKADADADEDEDEDEDGEAQGDVRDEGDVFGVGLKPNKQDIDFEMTDDMKSFIEKKYSIKDAGTFMNSVDKWRNQSQEATQVREEYDELAEGLRELPAPIKAAINAHLNAEDYSKAFNAGGTRLNFDVPFSKQEQGDIVQHYFDKEFVKLNAKKAEGDLDDLDYDERIETLYNSAERLFNSDHKSISTRRAEMLANQEKVEELERGSALSSVDKLKEKYPNFSKSDLQKVKQHLVDGDLNALFRSKDGSYKEEAATMLALAIYGDRVVDSLLNKAEKKGITSANEKIVARGNTKTRASKNQRTAEDAKAIDAVAHLEGQFGKDPYA